ncbi:hypothetical protein MED01_002363 [Micromonospora sp. MED01]|uniref:hypothetical protein n=1 Tax=Micromonospora alfalfae TaxID=2911212 RepID=UPI001EE82DC2|nr:hypothetical protein [Micromonospora alfalfae]MCG5464198.1 hypothetical protein [Micromonospora alfalfae]
MTTPAARNNSSVRTDYAVRDAFGNIHPVLSAGEAAEKAADNSLPGYGPRPRGVVQRTVLFSAWGPAEVQR